MDAVLLAFPLRDLLFLLSGRGYTICVNSFQLLFTTVFFNCRDSYGFITYRYTCDAFAALENGYTLRRSNEPDFELYFCGRKQFCKSNYADLGRYFALYELKYINGSLQLRWI